MKKTHPAHEPPVQPTGPMQFTALRSDLTAALKMSAAAVASRATLPILGHVLLQADAESQTLTLSATNLEISLTVRLGARVARGGAVTAPFKALSDLIASLEASDVGLLANPRTQSIQITGGRTRSTLKGFPVSDFPDFPPVPAERFSLPSADFKRLVLRSTFSAATDEARPVLTGANLILGASNLTLAAADGFRLAVATQALTPVIAGTAPSVVVPARALDQFARFITDSDSVEIGFVGQPGQAPTQLSLHCGALTLISQLIEGVFPDFNALLPPQPPQTCRVNRSALTRALKLARVFARDSALTARLKFTPASLVVSAVSAESGDGQSVLTPEDGYTYNGPELELGLNCDFLAELASAADTEQVAIGLHANNKPLTITPVGANGYHGVLMPMLLSK